MVRTYEGTERYTVYEIWEDDHDLERYVCTKTLRMCMYIMARDQYQLLINSPVTMAQR